MRLSPFSSRETDSASGATDKSDATGATAERGAKRRPVVEGLKGGLVATLVMTSYRLPIARSLPPTAEFWSRYVAGGDPADHPVTALALHLLYGTVGGGVFGALGSSSARRASRPDAPTSGQRTARSELVGLLEGVGYALALSAFGERVVLGRVLGMDLDRDESLVFHVGHLVYGLTLGTWVGSRTGAK
ncbi:hypothetical protein NGM10_06060 [Halorussus salilacus]|uniref:hypothetical protein n=1 Tax=Halorussus salilacus TaxID=2953750 RepID=UPI00209CC379|nr:hypothetical protein [Halorussus salilacus]USZ69298.1 hypothetical protein NGM10_06060 [Halorussus salilacus]